VHSKKRENKEKLGKVKRIYKKICRKRKRQVKAHVLQIERFLIAGGKCLEINLYENIITRAMYEYESEIEWIDDRRTKVRVKNFEIEVDSPPEFKGPEGQMTPEELFPGVLASCILTTFLEFKDKLGINLQSWKCKVKSVLGPSPEKGYRFESIHMHVILKVAVEDREKIPRAMELAHKYCFISRAIRNNVEEKIDWEFVE